MRLDVYLSDNSYFKTRTKATQAIERGEVYINGKQIKKPSYNVPETDALNIEIKSLVNFVSLGGYKLNKALNDFKINVKDLIVLDLGSSTGGFTDCVLQRGAKKIYAVDLNDTLLDESLKNNQKVVPIIKNVKKLKKEDLIERIDLIVADLSFISSSVYMNIISDLIEDEKGVILLIKPQFEIGEKKKFKNGIIKDKNEIKDVCLSVYKRALQYNLVPQNLTVVPFIENKNTEYLIYLKKNAQNIVEFDNLFNKA